MGVIYAMGDFIRELVGLLRGKDDSTTPLDDPAWGDGER